MALTDRQLLTLQRIKDLSKVETPEEIIAWCEMKLKQAWRLSYTAHPKAIRKSRRHHSREYYQQIISHFKNL